MVYSIIDLRNYLIHRTSKGQPYTMAEGYSTKAFLADHPQMKDHLGKVVVCRQCTMSPISHCEAISDNKGITLNRTNRHTIYSYVAICNICKHQWYICSHCPRFLTNPYEMTRHFKTTPHPSSRRESHNKNPNNVDLSFEDDDLDNQSSSSMDDSLDSDIDPAWVRNGIIPLDNAALMTSPVNQFFFGNTQSTYVGTKPSQEDDDPNPWVLGGRKLVGRAFAQWKQNSRSVHNWETRYHLKVTNFALSLGRASAYEFSDICGLLVEGVQDTSKFPETAPVTNQADMRSRYLKGRHSIARTSPRPRISGIAGHAVASLRDIVKLHVTRYLSNEFDNLDTTNEPSWQCLSSTKLCMSIAEEVERAFGLDVLTLHASLWSDDFETAMIKGLSLWIKTIEFFLLGLSQKSVSYIAALGKKGKDHEIIEMEITKELQQLRNPVYMYHAESGKMVKVVVRIITNIMDRPERCALNFISNSAGTAR